MSEQLESAPTSFTDEEGDTYVAESGEWGGEPTIKLWVSESQQEVVFFKSDATKIIALIAEAAKDEPRVLSQQEVADFARRWDARVEEGRK